MYDMAIIGGGPAGATLARLLAKDYNILLLDKTPPDSELSRGKCCGGLLAPDAQAVIAQLGLGVPKNVLVGPQLFVVRTIDLHHNIEQFYQRHYINVDRALFDHWLRSLIPSRVDLRLNARFCNVERTETGWKIRFIDNGQEKTTLARIIIGADGAFSTVRRRLFPQMETPKTYLAIQEWFRVVNPPPSYSAIFDPDITDFYAWTIPKEEHVVVGAAIAPGSNAYARFQRLKAKLNQCGFSLGIPDRKEGTYLFRPLQLSQICLGGPKSALIGEAAGFISPSSAEGISYAFRSAILLAESLKPGIDGFEKRYKSSTRALRLNILGKNLKSPGMYCPPVRRFVMRTGIKSVPNIIGKM